MNLYFVTCNRQNKVPGSPAIYMKEMNKNDNQKGYYHVGRIIRITQLELK